MAGCLTPTQVLDLAMRRAELMDAVSPEGAGLAGVAGLPRHVIEGICEKTEVSISISNSDESVVLGGTGRALEKAVELAIKAGAGTAHRLKVSVPSHTPLLKGAVAPLLEYILSLNPKPPKKKRGLLAGWMENPFFGLTMGQSALQSRLLPRCIGMRVWRPAWKLEVRPFLNWDQERLSRAWLVPVF